MKTICGYFVYIVIIKTCIILTATESRRPGTQPRCPVSPQTEQGHSGQPSGVNEEDLELTPSVLHSCSALCVEIALSSVSDGVSYSDGYNGEWLVSFLSNFVLLFDGR